MQSQSGMQIALFLVHIRIAVMINLDKHIIEKFDVSGPRYTSYPTAPEWEDFDDKESYIYHLKKVKNNNSDLSLYIHIPFCQKLCSYCGCNVAIRKNDPKYGDEYLNDVEKEIHQVSHYLGKSKKVTQLHLGGGTPTFLSSAQLIRLYKLLENHFDIDKSGEIAIEIEPRTVSIVQLETLRNLGFNRISMGVQDFDERVQESVNRVHSYEKVKEVYDKCRDLSFKSINMDFIYGLPHQTQKSFNETVDKILLLKPDRIAFYSFAFIPHIKKQQKKLPESYIPDSDEKLKIFLNTRKDLLKNGYQAIAMDHFALENDEMAKAFNQGQLKRNFMGYTLLPHEDFLGFGASSISYLDGAYFQNTKKLPEYQLLLSEDQFPIKKYCSLTKDDLVRRKIINAFMCDFKFNPESLSSDFYQDVFEEVWVNSRQHIGDCIISGLMIDNNGVYYLTELGKLFVRNVAMGFDAYLNAKNQKVQFSKVI